MNVVIPRDIHSPAVRVTRRSGGGGTDAADEGTHGPGPSRPYQGPMMADHHLDDGGPSWRTIIWIHQALSGPASGCTPGRGTTARATPCATRNRPGRVRAGLMRRAAWPAVASPAGPSRLRARSGCTCAWQRALSEVSWPGPGLGDGPWPGPEMARPASTASVAPGPACGY